MTVAIQAPPDQPCHEGPAALVCAFDVALAEADVDTAELLAVTDGVCTAADALDYLHAAITCISCGHTYPGHYWGCAQTRGAL